MNSGIQFQIIVITSRVLHIPVPASIKALLQYYNTSRKLIRVCQLFPCTKLNTIGQYTSEVVASKLCNSVPLDIQYVL